MYFYGKTAPTIGSSAFQNVHTTIHTYKDTEGFDSQTNEFISVAYDLSDDSVYTPPAPSVTEETAQAQTDAEETDEEKETEEAEDTTTIAETDAPTSTADDTASQTTASGNETNKTENGGVNIVLVIIIAVLALAAGVFATLFFVGRKK